MFTRDLHWSLSLARSLKSISPHPISLKSIFILPTHLHLGLPSGLLPCGFPTKPYMHSSPHACYMPCHSYRPWLGHSNYTWQRVQAVDLLIMQFSMRSCYFIHLQHPVLKHPQSCSSLNVRDQVSHPYRTTGKIIVLYILIFMFLDSDEKTKGSGLNGSKHYLNSVSS
jgi:hypothetical protein